ncbi:MAG: IS4 family transposase [Saprospiraceae bacterium]|nr:IS4 family transposase [Saprospiraceae bacterium]
MATKVGVILEGMNIFLNKFGEQREKYLSNPGFFTRDRVLTFWQICWFIVNQSKRSLSIELEDHFSGQSLKSCSKGAFSKARYRINPVFFKDWHRHLVELLYSASKKMKTWRGFRLVGVDGSTLYLPSTQEMADEFGVQENQYVYIPMARAGYAVDLLNGFCLGAWLGAMSEGEDVFAHEYLELSKERDIVIYDRNFPSFEFIYKHLEWKIPFVMRCKTGFNQVVQNFVATKKRQLTVEFPMTRVALKSLKSQGCKVTNDHTVKVRLLRIELGGEAEVEVLITSLLDAKKYPHSCFKTLYGLRWGIETQFDKIKNKMQIEIFSGHKPEAIYQDFYAVAIATNLHTMLVRECDPDLDEINKKRRTKVAINQNVTFDILKKRLIKLVANAKPIGFIKVIIALFITHLELVRPGRLYPRTRPIRRLNGKYQTFTNYRRAC